MYVFYSDIPNSTGKMFTHIFILVHAHITEHVGEELAIPTDTKIFSKWLFMRNILFYSPVRQKILTEFSHRQPL